MKTYTFKTNINCENCVAKISPFLNENSQIQSWKVDTQNPDKILIVESDLTENQVVEIVNKAGFQIKERLDTHTKASFWEDFSVWKRASKNTLNCLIGCSIGDFGVIIYCQTYHPQMSMYMMMILAMTAGLTTSIILETILLKLNEGFNWSQSLNTAFSMSFLSMLAMELSENITDLLLTGGQYHVHQPYYWFALACSLVAGFVVPLPYNYYKLKKYNKACH